MLERRVLNGDEWKNLTVYEQAVYIRIKHNYNGINNGDISFHYKELSNTTMSGGSIAKALSGLKKKGWIESREQGGYYRYQCFYKLTWKYDIEK